LAALGFNLERISEVVFMRILAIGDFHGKFFITKKFLKKNKIDLIISPGDLPDGGKLRAIIFKNWKKLRSKKLKFYEIWGLEKTRKLVLEDDVSQHKIFKKLDSLNIPVFLIIGNGDYGKLIENTEYAPLKLPYKIESECKNSKNVSYINLKIKKFDKFSIVGLDSIIILKEWRKGKDIDKEITKIFKSTKQPIIFLTHDPPYGILDKIKYKRSPVYGRHVGDKLTRELIEKFQPTINICGHMHENQGKGKIGKTLVVNAGFGRIGQCAIIDIDKKINVKFLKL
jgi:hypothetical protein